MVMPFQGDRVHTDDTFTSIRVVNQITAGDITAGDITAGDLTVGDITADDITVDEASIVSLSLVNPLDISDVDVSSLQAQFGAGNVAFVDQVKGVDGTATLGGRPFLTIGAALTAASAVSGACVYIYPGTYNESFTIPDNVAVRGQNLRSVIIQQIGVLAATNMITMGENTRLEDVTVILTSALNVPLKGIVFGGTTVATAKVRAAVVRVTNAGAGANFTYGVHSTGTGLASLDSQFLRACTVSAAGSGTGATRALLCDTAVHSASVRDCNFMASGGGSSIGCETNVVGTTLSLRTCSISGGTADISQTLGTMSLAYADLVTPSANGLSFSIQSSGAVYVFADNGSLPAGVTRYFYPGTESVSSSEILVRLPVKGVCRSIAVHNRVAATTRTDVFTVRKNGVNTAVTVTMPPATNSVQSSGASANFAEGDSLSVQVVTGGTAAPPSDTVVVVGFY